MSSIYKNTIFFFFTIYECSKKKEIKNWANGLCGLRLNGFCILLKGYHMFFFLKKIMSTVAGLINYFFYRDQIINKC